MDIVSINNKVVPHLKHQTQILFKGLRVRNINNTLKSKVPWLFKIKTLTRASS